LSLLCTIEVSLLRLEINRFGNQLLFTLPGPGFCHLPPSVKGSLLSRSDTFGVSLSLRDTEGEAKRASREKRARVRKIQVFLPSHQIVDGASFTYF
jgi:hypothetical protein